MKDQKSNTQNSTVGADANATAKAVGVVSKESKHDALKNISHAIGRCYYAVGQVTGIVDQMKKGNVYRKNETVRYALNDAGNYHRRIDDAIEQAQHDAEVVNDGAWYATLLGLKDKADRIREHIARGRAELSCISKVKRGREVLEDWNTAYYALLNLAHEEYMDIFAKLTNSDTYSLDLLKLVQDEIRKTTERSSVHAKYRHTQSALWQKARDILGDEFDNWFGGRQNEESIKANIYTLGTRDGKFRLLALDYFALQNREASVCRELQEIKREIDKMKIIGRDAYNKQNKPKKEDATPVKADEPKPKKAKSSDADVLDKGDKMLKRDTEYAMNIPQVKIFAGDIYSKSDGNDDPVFFRPIMKDEAKNEYGRVNRPVLRVTGSGPYRTMLQLRDWTNQVYPHFDETSSVRSDRVASAKPKPKNVIANVDLTYEQLCALIETLKEEKRRITNNRKVTCKQFKQFHKGK